MKTPSTAEMEALNSVLDMNGSPFTSPRTFTEFLPMAEMLAQSNIIADCFRNNPANCLLLIEFANRLKVPVLTLAQNLQIINGKPAWAGKYVIATLNNCGIFDRLKFEFFGEPGGYDYGCVAYATNLGTGERVEGVRVTWKMVVDSGWAYEGSPWLSMPDLMYHYRAASFFGSVHAAEVLLGLSTVEEIFDVVRSGKAAPVAPVTIGSANSVAHDAGVKERFAKLSSMLSGMPSPPPPPPVAVCVVPAPSPAAIQAEAALKAARKRSSKGDDRTLSLLDEMDEEQAGTPASVKPSVSALNVQTAVLREVPSPSPAPKETKERVEESPVAGISSFADQLRQANQAPGQPKLEEGQSPVVVEAAVPTTTRQSPTPSPAPHPRAAAPAPAPTPSKVQTAHIDLGTVKELCLRAGSCEEIAAVASQLSMVIPKDRVQAEQEVLESSLIFLGEESTLAGMTALIEIIKSFSDKQVYNIYRGAYNARSEVLQAQSRNRKAQ